MAGGQIILIYLLGVIRLETTFSGSKFIEFSKSKQLVNRSGDNQQCKKFTNILLFLPFCKTLHQKKMKKYKKFVQISASFQTDSCNKKIKKRNYQSMVR